METISRREFLIGATAATAGLLVTGRELFAQAAETAPAGPPVGIGVIGLGLQGKAILSALSTQPAAAVVAVCDTYEPYTKKALEIAPKATAYQDYKKLLEQQGVDAVVVATPSHKHKEIVLAALAAGKHVYCEAPIAMDPAEAKEIAKAALAAKPIFQAGLQLRANPLHKHVLGFVKTGVPGTIAQTRALWHKRLNWRRMAPTPEREAELNWKIAKASSAGLMGEVGIHQADVMSWYFDALPVAVTGWGGVMGYQDGRDVADTVQCVFEYPNNTRFVYDATLVSSYEGSYEAIYGSASAVLLRDQKAWMFKEADSAMLGWEVYARKEKVGEEEGIALVANATKQLQLGKEPGKQEADLTKDALWYSLEDFANNVKSGAKPLAGPEVAFRSVVVASKANEAVVSGSKITFQKEWFDLA